MNESRKDPEQGQDSDKRPYKWRYGPLRLVMPWLCVAVGIYSVVVNSSPLRIGIGLGLIAFGVVVFFVYRWMAKRGI